MAKLGSYYGLCPLIDQRSLLGITKDVNNGHVIVTLGKNIAIKYKLSDQKQVHSWRTKDKFSSPVIYDKKLSKYVAVFNQTYIRIWEGEEYLDKLKKFKFNKPIHTLLRCADESFIIFKTGFVIELNTALQSRKELNPDDCFDNSHTISDVCHITLNGDTYIGLVLTSANELILMLYTFNGSTLKQKAQKLNIKRENTSSLNGLVLNYQETQQGIQLVTAWSDGKLYCQTLENNTQQSQYLFAVVESISPNYPVTMVTLDHHYIAMYGADCNQEGATLIIYNTQFKVTQCKQNFKMFTSGAKLWCLENNLLLCVGQNLAVIPFKLDQEQLAALVGSHKALLNASDPDISIMEELEIVKWNGDLLTNSKSVVPEKIRADVMEFSKQGWPENIICENLLHTYIDNSDVEAIITCLEYFSDIPDYSLVVVLKFALQADIAMFKKHQPNKILMNHSIASLQPLERCMLIDTILMIACNDVCVLPHLRNELNFNDTLLLLQYICYLLSENGHALPLLNTIDSEAKLIEWGCLLLDANYQKFLLCQDLSKIEILKHFNSLVDKYLLCLEELRQLSPLLRELKNGKSICGTKTVATLKYSIEQLSLH